MGAKSRVARWGSSLAVRIPKPVAEQWGVQEGSPIEIVHRGDHVVLQRKTYDLGSMLDQVNETNLPSEWDTGPAKGGEEW